MKLADRLKKLSDDYYQRARDLKEQWYKMPEGENARITLGRSETAMNFHETLNYIVDYGQTTNARTLKPRLAALLSNYKGYKESARQVARNPRWYKLNELGGWMCEGNAAEYAEVIAILEKLVR